MFDQNIKPLRFNLSANRPLIGWDSPNSNILTEKRTPSKNSEPEYSKMRKKSAIVLNHSPSSDITVAAHNLLYLGLLEKNSMYPLVNFIPPRVHLGQARGDYKQST